MENTKNIIKNIIFDLGNVILKDNPSIVLNNINISDDEREIIKNTFFANWNELDLGNITIIVENINGIVLVSLKMMREFKK